MLVSNDSLIPKNKSEHLTQNSHSFPPTKQYVYRNSIDTIESMNSEENFNPTMKKPNSEIKNTFHKQKMIEENEYSNEEVFFFKYIFLFIFISLY